MIIKNKSSMHRMRAPLDPHPQLRCDLSLTGRGEPPLNSGVRVKGKPLSLQGRGAAVRVI